MNLKVYFIFLVLTSVLWLMMKLSDNYSRQVEVKLNFVDLPSGFAIYHQSDSFVTINVSAEGFKMISLLGEGANELPVSINDVLISQQSDGRRIANLNGTVLKKIINEQLGYNISEKNIHPESISVFMDIVDTSEVPVFINLNITPRTGYRIYGDLKIKPEKINVVGPRIIVDTIHRISSERIFAKDVHESFYQVIPLVSVCKYVDYEFDRVDVNVDVVEFIESQMEVPISLKTDITGMKFRIIPEKVRLNFQVALPDYPAIKPEMFEVVAQLDSMRLLRHSGLIPVLTKYPSNIYNPKLNVEKVDFIVVK
ncbi:MAG: hypothetical protein JXR34_08145 [Bacteroidales bacterium]|nr:hypothetical protein [Bacteroidales bacterium]